MIDLPLVLDAAGLGSGGAEAGYDGRRGGGDGGQGGRPLGGVGLEQRRELGRVGLGGGRAARDGVDGLVDVGGEEVDEDLLADQAGAAE